MSSISNREIIQEYVDGNGRTKEGGDTIRYIIEYCNSFDNSPTWKLCRNKEEYKHAMEHGDFVEPFLLWTRKVPWEAVSTYPTTINPNAPFLRIGGNRNEQLQVKIDKAIAMLKKNIDTVPPHGCQRDEVLALLENNNYPMESNPHGQPG